MIQFRCWYCNRRFARPEADARKQFLCTCGRPAKVPRRSGGSSKVRSPGDWVAEFLVYGGVGAGAGFVIGWTILYRFRATGAGGLDLVIASTVVGLVLGVLFGEVGMNWVGQRIRDRENERLEK